MTNCYNSARPRLGLGLAQPTGAWTNGFTYDGGHRLATVISPAGTFTYTYKGPGNLVTNLALPNSSRTTNAFDSVGRLTSTRLLTSGDSLLDGYAYIYNYAGQRTNLIRTDNSVVTNTYDNIGQLKSAVGSGGQSTENLGYLYDTAWNLNRRTNNGTPTTFGVNVKNELTSVGGTSYTYDYNGNLSTAGSLYYSYDDENQLLRVLLGNTWKTEFVHDGRGRLRVRKDYTWMGSGWYPNGETRYLYDGMRVIQEWNSGNTPTVAYTRGNDLSGSLEGADGIGGLLARSHGYSDGAFSAHNCYHADGNGSVTYLVNSAEARAAEYRYDPYGNLRYTYDPLGNRYRFSSKEQMSNSGLYYYGYRFYDPNHQRWLNRDPIGENGDLNLYRVVRNDPVVRHDGVGLIVRPEPAYAGLCATAIALTVLREEQSQRSPRWRYAHCRASCLIAKACGRKTAKIAGFAKEVADLLKCAFSLGTAEGACRSAFQPSDFKDNQRGRDCPDDETCEDRCAGLRDEPEAAPGPFYSPGPPVFFMPPLPLVP